MGSVSTPILQQLEHCHHRLDIEFIGLQYTVTRRKGRKTVENNILKEINGIFKSGHLIGVLGASGAGKSTLLNVLSGFRTHGVTGTILINGHERDVSQFRKSSCYIRQDCALMSYLTTEETLMIAADLKLGTDVSKTRKKSLVNEILQILGLVKTKGTLVGKLSGGEQKRLSVGVELLTNPPVMFFDEPTSGLDSVSSLQMITYLKSLAQAGRTVICTIHQPSSHIFEMFDNVYLLAEGQCLYSGPLDELTNVLEEEGFTCPKYYNRADFAIEVACKERGDSIANLITRFKTEKYNLKSRNVETLNVDDTRERVTTRDKSEEKALIENCNNTTDTVITVQVEDNLKPLYEYSAPFYFQFLVLVKRALICTYRNLFLGLVRFLTYVFVGILFGVLCYDIGDDASKVPTNVSSIFFFILFIFSLSPALTVLSFPLEASVFYQEHQNNWYPLRAYYAAKIVADLPLQIVCPTAFVLISYFLTGQPFDNMRPLYFWAICVLLSMCGQSMGFAAGTAFEAQMGLFVVIAVNIPLVLFSGFFIRFKDIAGYLGWLKHVSFYRYAFESVMLIVYKDRPRLQCSESYCYFKNPSKLLEEFGMEDSTTEIGFIGLSVWIIIFQIMFYFVLKWKIYITR